MADQTFEPVRIYVPQGSLGTGLFAEEVDYALAWGPHAMALDAGSTDAGAAYLATGESKNDRGSVKRDLGMLMEAQQKAGIPLLIGTAAQAGGDLNVDWTRDVALEIAREKGLTPKIALLYSEQSPALIKRKLAEGKVANLPPLGDLDDATLDKCLHIVALMGPEPYHAALEAGADIIIGGRTSDPAVIAAFATWKGAPQGPSWHAGKIAECGGQVTSANSGQRGLLIEIHADGFDAEPSAPQLTTSVDAISSHLLYENKSPFVLTEPGGELDVTDCEFVALSDRKVRVTGSVWRPKPYTMKLEGATGDKFQTLLMVGISDPKVLAEPEVFHDHMLLRLTERVQAALGLDKSEFDISLRLYGYNGLTGFPPGGGPPKEIGLLGVFTAATQALAHEIAKACNPYFFHMPVRLNDPLPSYGWAFTPGEIDRGPVYEFVLNHVVSVDDPMELVRMTLITDLAAQSQGEAA